jgi:hypothetical protein
MVKNCSTLSKLQIPCRLADRREKEKGWEMMTILEIPDP